MTGNGEPGPATRRLLIVAHVPSPNTQTLCDAVARGARSDEIEGVVVRVLRPFDAVAEDVLGTDAIILGTTENLGYMSGALKDFFDRTYYDCLDATDALPCAAYIRAGLDGTGTRRAIESITGGLRWRLVQDPLVLKGDYRDEFETQCEELGMAVAAGLEAGIF